MTVAIAGRRVDAPNANPPRFPLEALGAVSTRIEKVLEEVGARAVVASAACGADLIALDAAGRLGIRKRIVLPWPAAQFRASSVVDRPGDWGPLYDTIINEAEAAGDLVVLDLSQGDDAAYTETNLAIIREALALPGPHCAVIVWEGAPRGESDITAHFRHQALESNMQVREVLTRD